MKIYNFHLVSHSLSLSLPLYFYLTVLLSFLFIFIFMKKKEEKCEKIAWKNLKFIEIGKAIGDG